MSIITTYRGQDCGCTLAEHVITDDGTHVLEVRRLAEGRPGPHGNPRSHSIEGSTVPLDRFEDIPASCTHNRMYFLHSTMVPDPTRRRQVMVSPIGE